MNSHHFHKGNWGSGTAIRGGGGGETKTGPGNPDFFPWDRRDLSDGIPAGRRLAERGHPVQPRGEKPWGNTGNGGGAFGSSLVGAKRTTPTTRSGRSGGDRPHEHHGACFPTVARFKRGGMGLSRQPVGGGPGGPARRGGFQRPEGRPVICLVSIFGRAPKTRVPFLPGQGSRQNKRGGEKSHWTPGFFAGWAASRAWGGKNPPRLRTATGRAPRKNTHPIVPIVMLGPPVGGMGHRPDFCLLARLKLVGEKTK